MGVVSGQMWIGAAFPIALPKFVCAVYYFERPDSATIPLELRVFSPGDPEDTPGWRMPITIPQAAVDQLPSPDDVSDDPRVSFMIPVTFSPFVIMQEGILKVRMFRGENEVVRLGALKIESRPGLALVDALPANAFVHAATDPTA